MVKGQELKILFIADHAFLTRDVVLDFTQVQISDQLVRFKAEAYWDIRVINYLADERRLHVEVLKYHVGESDFSYEQAQLEDQLNEVKKVTFKEIDTSGLLLTLNGTSPLTYKPPQSYNVYRPTTAVQLSMPPFETKPVIKTCQEPFSIAIKDVSFHNGYVSFGKKLPGFKKPVAFQISNPHVVEQYDAIKNYFANVLQTKRITVVPMITLTDGEIAATQGQSAEIDRIDQHFIEEVKFQVIKAVRRKESSADNLLFTAEEYISALTSGDIKDLFNDENDFLQVVLEKSRTKHYHHLRFLSSKHQPDLQKLRVVHAPFSFVFLMAGAKQFHLVWETLDTQEATYIWSVPKEEADLPEFIKSTSVLIHRLIRDGKQSYISEKDSQCTRVFHDYTSDYGFRIWKDEIEQTIFK